jgi:hypothetical protein
VRSEFSKAYEHLRSLAGSQMSLRDVQDPKGIIAGMDVFLARPDMKPKAGLLYRLPDQLVAERHQLLDSPTFQLYASDKHKLCLFPSSTRYISGIGSRSTG